MGKLIFVTGGVRSGKSGFAAGLAQKSGKNVVFIATCVPQDDEMKHRVKLHVIARPKHWKTIEEPMSLSGALYKVPPKTDAVIVDCLTLLISNLLISGKNEKKILLEIKKAIDLSKKKSFKLIVISNEVGMGIVPENELARDFRDISGKVNQLASGASDEAYMMVAGIPMRLKGV
jgi:adenosylcobinamide kinase/adenosylcobinamide-phosphate guanylyltransferase